MSTATIRLLAPMRPVALTEDRLEGDRLRDATHNVVATTEDALAVLLAVFARNGGVEQSGAMSIARVLVRRCVAISGH
jgi:hypothetical protein